MPVGIHLSLERRKDIHRLCTQGYAQPFIYRVLFGNDPSKITPLYLVNRITFFLTADIGDITKYLDGQSRKGNCPVKMQGMIHKR
jgi:hypothetical protein